MRLHTRQIERATHACAGREKEREKKRDSQREEAQIERGGCWICYETNPDLLSLWCVRPWLDAWALVSSLWHSFEHKFLLNVTAGFRIWSPCHVITVFLTLFVYINAPQDQPLYFRRVNVVLQGAPSQYCYKSSPMLDKYNFWAQINIVVRRKLPLQVVQEKPGA